MYLAIITVVVGFHGVTGASTRGVPLLLGPKPIPDNPVIPGGDLKVETQTSGQNSHKCEAVAGDEGRIKGITCNSTSSNNNEIDGDLKNGSEEVNLTKNEYVRQGRQTNVTEYYLQPMMLLRKMRGNEGIAESLMLQRLQRKVKRQAPQQGPVNAYAPVAFTNVTTYQPPSNKNLYNNQNNNNNIMSITYGSRNSTRN